VADDGAQHISDKLVDESITIPRLILIANRFRPIPVRGVHQAAKLATWLLLFTMPYFDRRSGWQPQHRLNVQIYAMLAWTTHVCVYF
jgi:hypothetical protein